MPLRSSLRNRVLYFIYLYPLLSGRVEGTTDLMTTSEVINSTYPRACGIIRQGVPSQLMASIYHCALNKVSTLSCVDEESGKIKRSCFKMAFARDPDVPKSFVSKDLLNLLAGEATRTSDAKYFPGYLPVHSLPTTMSKLQKSIISTEKTLTDLFFAGIVRKVVAEKMQDTSEHFLPRFPSDELLRYDPGKNRACEEYAQVMSQKSLTLSATALTSYMLSIVEMIVLANGDRNSAKEILEQHIETVYLAARCRRVKGEQLQIPTKQLDSLIIRAHIAVLQAKMQNAATIVGSFPSLTAVRALIAGGRELFGDIIDRIEGLGSLGRSFYLTWEKNALKVQNIHDILGNETNIHMFNHFYNLEAQTSSPICNDGYELFDRLDRTDDEGESCCSTECMQQKGNIIDLAIMNEMCCFWCNQMMCNINMRAEVIALQEHRLKNQKLVIGGKVA